MVLSGVSKPEAQKHKKEKKKDGGKCVNNSCIIPSHRQPGRIVKFV